MRLACTTHYLQKDGSEPRDYEDAFYPRQQHVTYRRRSLDSPLYKRFAVADGATESLLARDWADLLVRTFCVRASNGRVEPETTYERAIKRWPRYLERYRVDRNARNEPVQWYEEPGLEKGAYATFLGLQLDQDGDARTWTAWALGDSCLLQVRRDQLVGAFPREPGDAFDTSPPLVFSKGEVPILAQHTLCATGSFECDDAFLLVTDAIAAWSLDGVARGSSDWLQLLDIEGYAAETSDEFEDWIQQLRSSGELKNDDVTVMRVSIEG